MTLREYDKYPEDSFVRKLAKWIGILCFGVLILSMGYFFAHYGNARYPSSDQMNGEEPAQNSEQLQSLVEKTNSLIENYREALQRDEVEKHHIEQLKQAIQLRERASRIAPNASDRWQKPISHYRKLVHDWETEPLQQKITLLKKQAKQFTQSGNYSRAQTSIQKAITLQKKILEQFPLSEHAKSLRLTRLERLKANIQAARIDHLSKTAEERAKQASKQQKWEEALRHYKTAAKYQRTLSLEYTQTRYAHFPRLRRLEREMATFDSLPLYQKLLTHKNKAADQLEKGNRRVASELYEQAREIQRRINREYPGTRFASSQRLEKMRVLSENAKKN